MIDLLCLHQQSPMFLLCLALLLCSAYTDPGVDELVSSVPNYASYFQRVFAGYLPTSSDSRKLHYVFMEHAKGPNNELPVTLWMNGGPGCSSKLGFLQEIPPFFLPLNTPYSTNMVFESNPYSWISLSNLLFVDSPAGVGYSINEDKSYVYNDINTANDNFFALKQFFKVKFPEYMKNDFYIAGQSYAGKYIPDLAVRINSDPSDSPDKINLKGVLIGNGVMSFLDLEQNSIEYMISHNFIDPKLVPYYQTACRKDYQSAGCQYFLSRYDDLTDLIDPYNVYGPCESGPPTSSQSKFLKAASKRVSPLKRASIGETNPLLGDCGYDKGVEDYFTDQFAAFHAKPTEFTVCNDTIFDTYSMNPRGSMDELSQLMKSGTFKIFLFNGDWDDVVPFTDTLRNLDRLGVKEEGAMTPWKVEDQHAGFIRKYSRGLTFYIVKGAGHEVPQYQRARAYQLFAEFLK